MSPQHLDNRNTKTCPECLGGGYRPYGGGYRPYDRCDSLALAALATVEFGCTGGYSPTNADWARCKKCKGKGEVDLDQEKEE